MKNSIRKNIILALGLILCICIVVVLLNTELFTTYAALHDSDIISETFTDEELPNKKWNIDTGSNNDSIKSYTNGNGVYQISAAATDNMKGSYYFDKYVLVEDNEDLIIEYTVSDFYISNNNSPSSLMLVKGLGSEDKTPSDDIEENGDAMLEGISAFFETGRAYLATGYSMRSGVTSFDANTSQVSVSYSSRSEFIQYCQDNIFNDYIDNLGYNIAYGFDNITTDDSNADLRLTNVRSWCGEKFDYYIKQYDQSQAPAILYSQDEIDAYSIYHIFEQGFTFKHIYKSTGGYECYVKPANADDESDYVMFASLSDTLPGTSIKRFVKRSGYIGFNTFGQEISLSLDDFNVYTVDSLNVKTEHIGADFSLDSEENRYGTTQNGANDWKSTKPEVFTSKVIYEEMGFLFNNPDEKAFLYSDSKTRIKFDGLYDDYAVVDFKVSIKELTEGKDFGLIIGGTSVDHLLNHNNNIFVYLRNMPSETNYVLGVDKIEQLTRVNYGLKKTAVPKTSPEYSGDSYTLRVIAQKDGLLKIVILDGEEQVGNTLVFGDSKNQLLLQNRVAIYSANNEYSDENSSAVVLVTLLKVRNKYYNTIDGASNVTIEENFEGKNDKGEYKAANGVSIYYGSGGSNTTITNAGVFAKDGGLLLRGVGYRAGIASRYAYNSFDMYIDIVDIERTSPMGIAPIVFEFGAKSEGLSNGSNGTNISIRNPVCIKDNQGKIVKAFNGDSGLDPSLSNAVAYVEDEWGNKVYSTVAFSSQGKAKDFGVLRHNLLDPALEGHSIRFKLSYSNEGIVSLAYYVMGLEDEAMLNVPIASEYFEGGEGYVGITSTHTLTTCYYANMILDNFKVIDTDTVIQKEPVIIEDDDFDYADYLYDFVMTDKNDEERASGCSSEIGLTSYYGAICLVFVAFIVIKIKGVKLYNEKN